MRSKQDTDTRRVLIYAGRYSTEVNTPAADGQVPETVGLLDEWDVGKHELPYLLEKTRLLIVLDPLSFPWELVDSPGWDTPMAVCMDVGLGVQGLESVLGAAMLEKLGFFDYLITSDPLLWEQLRDRYGWSEHQLIFTSSAAPPRLAAEALQILGERPTGQSSLYGDGCDARLYWEEKDESTAHSKTHSATCGLRNDRKSTKALHHVQLGAIGQQFEKILASRAAHNPGYVLEVGAGIGRWISVLGRYPVRFTGVDISEGMVEAARTNFPNSNFQRLGEDLSLDVDDESFDIVFSVSVMHYNSGAAKRALVAEMWRVTKPGGKLLFLENFVTGERDDNSAAYPMGINQFSYLIQECSAGQVVLDHVEALRYPYDDMYCGGLISLSKIGAPTRW